MTPDPPTGSDQGEREEPPENLTGTVVRGAAIAGVGYGLSVVITLAGALVLARILEPSEIGEFAAGSILLSVSGLATDSGMMAALIHRPDRIEEAMATALAATAAAGLILGALSAAVSPLIGVFFDSETIGRICLAVSGVILLRALLVVPEAMLQRRFSFLRRLVSEPSSALVYAGTAIALAPSMGTWALVIAAYAAVCTELILTWGLARIRPRPRLASFGMWREMVAYGRHVFVGAAVIEAGDMAPTAIVGRFVGAGALGQFRYGKRISDTPFGLLLAAASYVIFPALARIAHDGERIKDGFRRSLRWMTAISMPAGAMLFAVAAPLAVIAFGDQWTDAGKAAMALCLFPAARSIESIASEGLKAAGQPRFLVRMHVVEALVTIGLMLALLPFDLIGVCVGISIGSAIGAAYALLLACRTVDLPYARAAREVFPALGCAVVVAPAMLLLERGVFDAQSLPVAQGLGALTLVCIAGAALYALLMRLVSPGLSGEIGGLVRAARNRG